MTDIKFRLKKTEEFFSQTNRQEEEHPICSKIFKVFTFPTKPETVEELINLDSLFLDSLGTFKVLDNKIKVGKVSLEINKHSRFSSSADAHNYDYFCSIYSETFIVIGEDFKPINEKIISAACQIEGQHNIFIFNVDLDLAAYNKIVMERF